MAHKDGKAIIAGVMIALGGYANIKFGGLLGAVLFSIGLLSVIKFQLPLFTGMVSNLDNYKKENRFNLIKTLFLNIIGAFIFGILTFMVIFQTDLQVAINILGKFDKDIFTVIFDGIVCGFCVSIAAKSKDVLITILAVTFFVICGGEHCIADMYYFTTMGANVFSAFIVILLAAIGNTIGGYIIGLATINKD